MPSIIPQPRVDFSDRDFDSVKLRLQGLLRSVFPTWTEFNIASFGNMMLELFADISDGLHFYVDKTGRNVLWPTVESRIQAIRLGRLFDFVLASASAASVDVTFSLPTTLAVDVTIPEGTLMHSKDPENPASFRTVAEAVITAGSLSVDVSVENASVRTDTFTSTGGPNQEFGLGMTPYLDGTASVTATDGVYVITTSFLGAAPDDRVFVVFVDQFDTARIRFGNGTLGAIPQGTLTVTYKTGGGAAGNVEAGQITVLDDIVLDGGGNVAALQITNALAASGGTDRQSVAAARALAPASLRTLTRCVTQDDFENTALGVSGVARALMATSNESASIQENTGVLYVVAAGAQLDSGRSLPGTPSAALLSSVLTAVTDTKPPTLTFALSASAATFVQIDVSVRVFLALGADEDTVSAEIYANLQDHFAVLLDDGTANPDIDFGAKIKDVEGTIVAEVAWSDIFNVVRDTTGVRAVDPGPVGLLLNESRSSPSISALAFPTLGDVEIIDAATGTTLFTQAAA